MCMLITPYIIYPIFIAVFYGLFLCLYACKCDIIDAH